jgi:outer membrane protein OmpA-like peptidoglycan-associated protein
MNSSIDNGRRRAFARVIALASGVALMALAGCVPPPQPVSQVVVPEPVAAPVPERTLILTVNFEFDSAALRPDAVLLLTNVAAAMTDQSMAGTHFEINGHTDIIGRLDYNIALSQLRAQAVVDFLAGHGVPLANMHSQGFGPLQLLDPAHPASPVNRRVEIVAIH